MRDWPRAAKEALRFLGAARYYLPAQADCAPQWEQAYASHLRAAQFEDALVCIEQIGDMQGDFEHAMQFWKELFYVAQHLGLQAHAQRYEGRLREIAAMRRL